MSSLTFFQHIDCEGPGSLLDVLKSKNIQSQILKPFKGDPIPEHLGGGLVVLGGPQGVYEEKEYPWMTAELDAIRRCLKESIPVLGICLGSQMLAKAAGAQVFRGAMPEVGWYPITLTPPGHSDGLFLGLPESFEAFHWHGDTFTLPEGAQRLAESGYYPNQIYKVGNNAYGFQCHLETTEQMIKSWAALYAKELTPQGGPIEPAQIETKLSERSKALQGIATQVFSRFAALL